MIDIAIDTLPGPTHNFSGLSTGNLASQENKYLTSRPRHAALECLKKMELISSFGIPQFILPPLPRPDFAIFQQIQLSKNKKCNFNRIKTHFPEIFRACLSSSSMWSANIATITPAIDTNDKKIHITPANLGSHLHRASEVKGSTFLLRYFFQNVNNHTLHHPLPLSFEYCDEGAANTLRLFPEQDRTSAALQIFVFGRTSSEKRASNITPRQTEGASRLVAAQHMIRSDNLLFLQQNPEAVDAGVFHNDVISFGHKNIFAFHEKAFLDSSQVIQRITNTYEQLYQEPLYLLSVHTSQLPLEEAVKTYFFNSQLITCPMTNKVRIIAPIECTHSKNAMNLFSKLELSFPIESIHFIETTESMMNGGGPACLRLQLPVASQELSQLPKNLLLSQQLAKELRESIESLYPEKLTINEIEYGEIPLYNSAIHAIWILLGLGEEWKKITTLFGIPDALRS